MDRCNPRMPWLVDDIHSRLHVVYITTMISGGLAPRLRGTQHRELLHTDRSCHAICICISQPLFYPVETMHPLAISRNAPHVPACLQQS